MEAPAAPAAPAKASALALILPLLLGIGGSVGLVSLLGSGTYDVSPLRVKMSVKVATSGDTALSVEAPGAPAAGKAVATTHDSPLRFDATIVGIDAAGLGRAVVDAVTPTGQQTTEPLNPAEPASVARYLASNGKSAARSFGIKVGLLAAGGGLVGAGIGALGNRKRSIAGLIAGLAVVGALGLIAQQTYDVSGFEGTTFEQVE